MAERLVPSIEEVKQNYIDHHPGSQSLYERAASCFASGVTHDSRYVEPFPVYMTKAKGSKKWDVDGNQYVDYVMGHGSLLFGYCHDAVQSAFEQQVNHGVHMGSSTELEIRWAELIKELVPCAKNGLVRACSSGSEAIAVAIRLSRIHTGNDKVVMQAGAYHGKNDQVNYVNNGPPFGHKNTKGIPEGIRENVKIVPFNDLDAVERKLSEGNVACVFLHSNNLYSTEYIEGLRELTAKYGAVFIMDEVVSGFRYAPGGAHEYYDVMPDLAVLGKIVGGGGPIGAVCGKPEIMQYHEFRDDAYWNGFQRIAVGGTWNAQPISIVGGIAMMEMIAENQRDIYSSLYETGHELVRRFNDHAEDLGISAVAYGLPIDNPTRVTVQFFDRPLPSDARRLFETGPSSLEDYETKQEILASGAKQPFHLAMLNNGVFGHGGGTAFVTCTEHSESDIDTTSEAFREALKILQANDLVGES